MKPWRQRTSEPLAGLSRGARRSAARAASAPPAVCGWRAGCGCPAPCAAGAAAAKAKAVIQIWLWGGPSPPGHLRSQAGGGQRLLRAAQQRPSRPTCHGIRICELLPLLAKQADKYSLIRSMTHGNNAHETAAYMVQTGRPAGGRDVFPCIGAVVSLFKGYDAGYKGLIPPYIVLTEPQGRFSEAGFLGSRYKPFATGGDPAQTPFAVEGVMAQGIYRPAAAGPARIARTN